MTALRDAIQQHRRASGSVGGILGDAWDAAKDVADAVTPDVGVDVANKQNTVAVGAEGAPEQADAGVSAWWYLGGVAAVLAAGAGVWWYMSSRKSNPARLTSPRGLTRDVIEESIEQGLFRIKRPDMEFLRDKWLLRLRECDVCGRKLPQYLVGAGVCSEACAAQAHDPEVRALFQQAEKDPRLVKRTECRACGAKLPGKHDIAKERRFLIDRGYCSRACAGLPKPKLSPEHFSDQYCKVCETRLPKEERTSASRRQYVHRGYCGKACAEEDLGTSVLPPWERKRRPRPSCKRCGEDVPMLKEVSSAQRLSVSLGFCSRKCHEAGLPAFARQENPAKKSMRVQALLFPRDLFTEKQAKAWAKDHGFRYGKVHVTVNYIRLRQSDPSAFGFFRTIRFGDSGIKAVVGR